MPQPVTAVVVNYNAGHHLIECVRSLRAEDVVEIVVADNDSHDGSVDALRAADPDVVVVQTGANLGFGTAANRGAALAMAGTHLLVMNPDAVVEPGGVKAMMAALDLDPGLAVVGPGVENPDGTTYPSARRFPSMVDALGHAFLHPFAPGNPFSRRYRMLDTDTSGIRQVDWVSGTCMLVRREAWQELGGFDEAYFMYVEDVDLCWRAWRAGWRVAYEPAARVVHVIGVSSDQRPYRMIVEHHRSLFRFARKSASGMRRLLLPAVALALAVRVALVSVERAVRRRPPAARQ